MAYILNKKDTFELRIESWSRKTLLIYEGILHVPAVSTAWCLDVSWKWSRIWLELEILKADLHWPVCVTSPLHCVDLKNRTFNWCVNIPSIGSLSDIRTYTMQALQRKKHLGKDKPLLWKRGTGVQQRQCKVTDGHDVAIVCHWQRNGPETHCRRTSVSLAWGYHWDTDTRERDKDKSKIGVFMIISMQVKQELF